MRLTLLGPALAARRVCGPGRGHAVAFSPSSVEPLLAEAERAELSGVLVDLGLAATSSAATSATFEYMGTGLHRYHQKGALLAARPEP